MPMLAATGLSVPFVLDLGRLIPLVLDLGRFAPLVLDLGRLVPLVPDLGRLVPVVLDLGKLALDLEAEYLTCHASAHCHKIAFRREGADTLPMQTLFRVPKSKWQKAPDGRSRPTSASLSSSYDYLPQLSCRQAAHIECRSASYRLLMAGLSHGNTATPVNMAAQSGPAVSPNGRILNKSPDVLNARRCEEDI